MKLNIYLVENIMRLYDEKGMGAAVVMLHHFLEGYPVALTVMGAYDVVKKLVNEGFEVHGQYAYL